MTEGRVKKDKSGNKECSTETCGPNIPPMPIMIKRQNPAEKVEQETRVPESRHDDEDMTMTNFTCDDKPYIPGLYADMEADCQMFHLCMKKIVDHFMCPTGSTFDQKYLVCRREGKEHCKQSPSFYVRNAKVLQSFHIFSYLEAFDDYENKHFYLDLLRNIQNSNTIWIDQDITKALILLQFVQASQAKPDLRNKEIFGGIHPRRVREVESGAARNVLRNIINFIFPILPLPHSSDLIVLEQDSRTKTPNQTTAAQSSYASDSVGNRAQNYPLTDKPHVSENPTKKAVQVAEMILETIGDTFGSIRGISRRNFVQNHLNYMNT